MVQGGQPLWPACKMARGRPRGGPVARNFEADEVPTSEEPLAQFPPLARVWGHYPPHTEMNVRLGLGEVVDIVRYPLCLRAVQKIRF